MRETKLKNEQVNKQSHPGRNSPLVSAPSLLRRQPQAISRPETNTALAQRSLNKLRKAITRPVLTPEHNETSRQTSFKANNLSREFGNSADLQRQHQSQAPAGKEPLAYLVQQKGDTTTIQRKVGFEFEDNKWRAWKHVDRGIRPAHRKEVLHEGDHFALEGDDSPGPQASNLEFVTEPFDTTLAGINQLNQTMTQIKAIVRRIGQYSGKLGNQVNTAPRRFVRSNKHRLNKPHTWLSAGEPHANFKMQATQGISIEDIPTIMEHFGTPAGEQIAQTTDRGPSRQALYGNQNYQTAITNIMGNAPRLAREAILAFIPQIPNEEQPLFDNTNGLAGFLSVILMYIKLLAVPRGNALKFSIPLLLRNNFVALFRSVPTIQRHYLRKNRALFFQEIMTAANQQGYMAKPQQLGGGFWDENRQLTDPLLTIRIRQTAESQPHENVQVMNSLRIQDWLEGVVRDGVDYLQPQTMLGWLNTHEQQLTDDQKQRSSELLESFATLGNNKDNSEQAGKSKLNIFENRQIIPSGNQVEINEEEAHRTALNYLTFFVNLRENQGQPGQFPNNPVPN